MTPPRGSRRRDARGAVTAELAVALPLLVAVTVGLVWLLSVGLAQLRVVDAAREAARAVARGEDESSAVRTSLGVAPPGAAVDIETAADTVTVSVSAPVEGPGGLFAFVPGVDVRSVAVAAREPGS